VNSSLAAVLIGCLLFSCRPPVQEPEEKTADIANEKLLNLNIYLREIHQDHIRAFLGRVGWDMEVTSTGLWYSIVEKESGEPVEMNSRVTYIYSSLLLDGTPCYEANVRNPETTIIGKDEMMSGLMEGLLKMNAGDSAIFIIPPHLGHGNFGDRNKIPGNSVIIYKVKVLKVN